MKAFTTAFALLASASSAFGALQQVTGFGTNPTSLQMYISVPAKVATNPAIIVAVSPAQRPQMSRLCADLNHSFIHVAALHRNGTAALSYQHRRRA